MGNEGFPTGHRMSNLYLVLAENVRFKTVRRVDATVTMVRSDR